MSDYRRLYIPGGMYFFTLVGYHRKPIFADSPVGRNKPVRAVARTGVSGKHHPNSPETPPRATRLDGLIPAYA